jgi:hypothetical protein
MRFFAPTPIRSAVLKPTARLFPVAKGTFTEKVTCCEFVSRN